MSDSTAPLHPDPEIAASLEFDPVPRKVERVGGWNAETQRAFIAALAITGSPRRAAHAVDMQTFGAERLRGSQGAESFSAAWDRAIEIAAATRSGRLRETLDKLQSSTGRGGGAQGAAEGEWRPAEPLPVVCDSCRAEGAAGDEAFSAIPDILAFDPVPRAAHDKLWPPETQRAFIAALAVTGSVVRAARSVGRHAFGVEKLRKGRGARGFNEAFEAALDLARERELSRLHGKLDQLASPPAEGEERGGQVINELGEYEDAASYERRGEEARASIFEKLQRMRRNMLRDEIMPDPEKRAAWILLNGPEEIEAIEAGTWKAEDWRAENAQS